MARRSKAFGLAALLAVALTGAACAKSYPSASGGTSPVARASQGGGGGGRYGDYGGAPQPTASVSGSLTIQQGAGGFVFSPAELTVKEGDTVTVTNVGTAAHTFTVTNQSIDITNDPGKSTGVAIDLPPGTYPFICRFHAQLGMTGTLTVTS
jgi:plastocyanin